MPALRIMQKYRLPPPTVEKIAQVAQAQGGLTHTRVIELAVDELHRQVCRPVDSVSGRRLRRTVERPHRS